MTDIKYLAKEMVMKCLKPFYVERSDVSASYQLGRDIANRGTEGSVVMANYDNWRWYLHVDSDKSDCYASMGFNKDKRMSALVFLDRGLGIIFFRNVYHEALLEACRELSIPHVVGRGGTYVSR